MIGYDSQCAQKLIRIHVVYIADCTYCRWLTVEPTASNNCYNHVDVHILSARNS